MDLNVLKPASINPDLSIEGQSQRFIYGDPLLPEPTASFKLDNIYIPVIGSPSFTNSEIRNNVLSGYRWVHETQSTETYGSYRLQKFLYANPTGIDLMAFNNDGTFAFPGLFGSLATGILKNTTTTGIISIAVPGTDYYSPGNPTTLLDDYIPISLLGNLSVGTNSLSSLVLGSNLYTNNTSIGANSLASLILSGNNTSVGRSSLFKLTSNSNNNTSVGVAAAFNLTSNASNNCFFGMQAGLNYTASSFNCLFGFGSGGNFDNLQNCCFFGSTAGASASNLTNAIAIGSTATVGASNTITLGNSSITNFNIPGLNFGFTANTITSTNTNGNITVTPNGSGIISLSSNTGIGTSTPTQAQLVVNGGVQNVSNEQSALRVTGSLNNIKIELQSTAASGRLYELTSDNGGNFLLTDRTNAITRLYCDTNGYIGVNVTSSLKGRIHTLNGPQNQTNESTGICIETSNTNTAKLELRNSNTNGRLYEIQSNNNAGAGNAFFDITDRTGAASRIRILSNGNIGLNNSSPAFTCDVGGTTKTSKLLGNFGNFPTVVAGSAAGSSPTLQLTGSELSGTFLIIAGTTPSGTLLATFTLTGAMSNLGWGVLFTPANQVTAALAQSWSVATSNTQITLSCVTPLVATTHYLWNYTIIGT